MTDDTQQAQTFKRKTLKLKDTEKTKITKEKDQALKIPMTYSPFKPVKVTERGRKTIQIIHNYFDNFYKQLKKIQCNTHEKYIVIEKLQESCRAMCRGVAVINEDKEKDNE